MMDSFLRKRFLENLTLDMEWADEKHPPSNDEIWGSFYWNEASVPCFYNFNPQLYIQHQTR